METTAWIIKAGQLYAKAYNGINHPDRLQRHSAENWLAIAKADLALATETVSHLKRCYAMDAAVWN